MRGVVVPVLLTFSMPVRLACEAARVLPGLRIVSDALKDLRVGLVRFDMSRMCAARVCVHAD